MQEVVDAVKDFGFPIVAAMGMLYMIYFVWKTITTKIESELEETHLTLIGLIDRIRMLDNDIIRLQQKLDTAIEVNRRNDEGYGKDKRVRTQNKRKTT